MIDCQQNIEIPKLRTRFQDLAARCATTLSIFQRLQTPGHIENVDPAAVSFLVDTKTSASPSSPVPVCLTVEPLPGFPSKSLADEVARVCYDLENYRSQFLPKFVNALDRLLPDAATLETDYKSSYLLRNLASPDVKSLGNLEVKKIESEISTQIETWSVNQENRQIGPDEADNIEKLLRSNLSLILQDAQNFHSLYSNSRKARINLLVQQARVFENDFKTVIDFQTRLNKLIKDIRTFHRHEQEISKTLAAFPSPIKIEECYWKAAFQIIRRSRYLNACLECLRHSLGYFKPLETGNVDTTKDFASRFGNCLPRLLVSIYKRYRSPFTLL